MPMKELNEKKALGDVKMSWQVQQYLSSKGVKESPGCPSKLLLGHRL